MPRTKRAAKPKRANAEGNKKLKEKELILMQMEKEEREVMDKIDKQLEQELKDLQIHHVSMRSKLPLSLLSRTVKQVKNGEVCDEDLSLAATLAANLTNTFHSTKNTTCASTSSSRNRTFRNLASGTSSGSDSSEINKTKIISRSRTKRSISVGCDDEGYTTAESAGDNSGSRRNPMRQSRSKTASKPISRSLSRCKGNVSRFKTPTNRQLNSNSVGTITPKCKPNTPLLFVRRPKMGETGWSNQGSPLLLSGTVAPEGTANVNIPIGDNMLSLLPTRDEIRRSQIPDIEDGTRRQLVNLRDQLIKWCDFMGK